MVDAFNTQHRKKSLMEVHMEQQEKSAKEAKKAKKQKTAKDAPPGGGGKGADASDWPWKPFDREKDLAIRPKAKSQAGMLQSAANLAGKFNSAGGTRNVL